MSAAATVTTVKERPIILSGPVVKAILEGRKTQERVAIQSPKWLQQMNPDLNSAVAGKAFGVTPCLFVPCADGSQQRLRNPWDWPDVEGAKRLWVREALRWTDFLVYDADQQPVDPDLIPAGIRIGRDYLPMTHMPRWASRITLEITNVRVERLQEITRADSQAEGFLCPCCKGYHSRPCVCIDLFWEQWDKVNERRGILWSENPWVWVITFKKL